MSTSQAAGWQGLTDIEGLISIRDGAGEVQQQHIRSAVVEEELGALQRSSLIMSGSAWQPRARTARGNARHQGVEALQGSIKAADNQGMVSTGT